MRPAEVHRALQALGYVMTRHSKHMIWRCGKAQLVTTSTRYGHRGAKNVLAEAKRRLRQVAS